MTVEVEMFTSFLRGCNKQMNTKLVHWVVKPTIESFVNEDLFSNCTLKFRGSLR